MALQTPNDEATAPQARFSQQSSPFFIKNGVLQIFRPGKAIAFLRDTHNTEVECNIVLAGLFAWIVAPTGVINTRQFNRTRVNVQEFIHSAMVMESAEVLESAFGVSRFHQLSATHIGEIEQSGFLDEEPVRSFSWEIFFALGGMRPVLDLPSRPEYERLLESQYEAAHHVVAIIDAVIENSAQSAKRRLNSAAQLASAKLSRKFPVGKAPRGLQPATMKNHWRALREAAPFLYAARQLLEGDFLKLIFRDPTLEAIPDQPIREWLGKWLYESDAVAERLIALQLMTCWPPGDLDFSEDSRSSDTDPNYFRCQS